VSRDPRPRAEALPNVLSYAVRNITRRDLRWILTDEHTSKD